MSHLGRYQQGHTVSLTLSCVDSQGTPTLPLSAPRCMISKVGGSTIASFQVPILDPAKVTGLFHENFTLDGNFSSGQYVVTWEANVSGMLMHSIETFEVVSGGDPFSYVLSMEAWQRPEVQNILMQTNSGRYRYGQNPSLPTQEV